MFIRNITVTFLLDSFAIFEVCDTQLIRTILIMEVSSKRITGIIEVGIEVHIMYEVRIEVLRLDKRMTVNKIIISSF